MVVSVCVFVCARAFERNFNIGKEAFQMDTFLKFPHQISIHLACISTRYMIFPKILSLLYNTQK